MKTAIVGCGGIARVHAAALQKEHGVELTAFADCIPSRAGEFVKAFGTGDAKAYASYEEMILVEQPDVVHICTPHYLHVPQALFALEHGCHVFMEKPPGITREEFAKLTAARNMYGKITGICLQNRYNQTTRKVKELLDSKEAGAIKGARAFVTWCRNEAYYTKSGWRGSLETEGGGALINQAVHTLDLLVHFMGEPVWTESSMANHHLPEIIEVEDTVEAYIRFRHGAASFYATTAYAADADVLLELQCENMSIRLEGNQVSLRYRDGRREIFEFSQGIAADGKTYWGNGHEPCIHDFYHSLSTGEAVFNSPESAADTFSLMMDIYQSAREHRRIVFGDNRIDREKEKN